MADALGVSVNALVHHFGSKEEIVVAALRRANEMQIEVLRPLAGPPIPISAWPTCCGAGGAG